jgi:hypothetical protein
MRRIVPQKAWIEIVPQKAARDATHVNKTPGNLHAAVTAAALRCHP